MIARSALMVGVVGVVGLLAFARPAAALERGQTCTLRTPLQLTIHRPQGKVEALLDPGVAVEVIAVGDERRARISTGETKGSVAEGDLDAACEGTLILCRLGADITMYEKNRSDSKSWRVKQGAQISLLRAGKTWAQLRVGDLEGFSYADEAKKACKKENLTHSLDEAPTEIVERGDGPGVLLLPFALQGSSSAGVADALTDVFFDGLALYRPDAARLPFLGERSMGLKQLIDQAALRARAAGMQWAIIGALSEEAGSDGRITWVLSLGLVEALTGKMVKGIRAKTASQELGPWVNSTLSVLLPIVPSAPGSSIPKPKR